MARYGYAPSQACSSSAFRFRAFTSSSFFLASNPSFARFILIAFLLRSSSSIRSSLLFARSRCLNVGLSPLSLWSSCGVVVGSSRASSTPFRAWLITASSSSRLSLSLSSVSAYEARREQDQRTCPKGIDAAYLLEEIERLWCLFVRALVRMDNCVIETG